MGSGEDVLPGHLETKDTIAMIVCDGHSGHECTDKITKNMSEYLSSIVSIGVLDTMALCSKDMQTVKWSGAMIVMVQYEKKTRTIHICSRGDTSAIVYQNDSVVFHQPHHSQDDINANQDMLADMKAKNITKVADVRPELLVQANGSVKTRRMYRYTRAGIAAASFIGHSGITCMDAVYRSYQVPRGPFRLVLCSDGLTDVIHPADAFLCKKGNADANTIGNEAIRRWSSKSCFTMDGYQGKTGYGAMPTNTFRRVNEQSGLIDHHVYPLHARPKLDPDFTDYHQVYTGADDISILVLNVMS